MGTVKAGPVRLRDFRKVQDDYDGVAAVVTAVWPDYPLTEGELKHDDAHRDPALIHSRIVAEQDGQIIGFGAYGEPEGEGRSGKFLINAAVHPDHWLQGTGRAIYNRILDALPPHHPITLIAFVQDDKPESLSFLEKRGFEVVLRRPVLRLDVGAFDTATFRPREPDLEAQSITIAALSELVPDVPDWKHRCWDLDWKIAQDIPSTDSPTRPSFERYSLEFDDPVFDPAGWFIARDGDDWVGMSTIIANPSTPGVFFTGVTGVCRGYRRRGIAMALKLRGIDYVRVRNGRIIETDNEEHNPMLDLNRALGFKPGPTLLELRAKL